MNSNVPTLNRHHAKTLEEILDHQSRNVEWRDILNLFEHLGNVVQRHDGKFEFQIGSTSAVLTKPHGKDADVSELVVLRRLLAEAGFTTNTRASAVDVREAPISATAVLIDHYRARLFEPDADGAHLVEREHLEVSDAQDLQRQLREGQLEGERAQEATDYYERIAQALKDKASIVLIGDAHGKSSAMLDLLDFLKKNHKDIAQRVVGTADADLSSITLPRIESIARAYQP